MLNTVEYLAVDPKIKRAMKYLISIVFLLCSVGAFGQDLIMTTAGDSLKCKIVEVNAGEIQFRFGTGGIISIERKEVASYQYNFAPATPANRTTPARNADPVYQMPANVSSNDFPKFYAGLVVGLPTLIGVNGAYFFNHLAGAGFAVHHQILHYYDETYYTTFFGPVFYGHWGRRNGKFFFPTNIGLGAISYKYTYDNSYLDYDDTELGFFTSFGAAFKPTKSFSIGLNLDLASTFTFEDGIVGVTLGVNFHF